MDREVMDMIDAAVSRLPVPTNQDDYRLYEAYKRKLREMFHGWDEQEYLCKAIARRCGI